MSLGMLHEPAACGVPGVASRLPGPGPAGRAPAGEIEAAVIDRLRAVFRQPEIVAAMCNAGRAETGDITESDARAALQQLDPLLDQLFPAEQARMVAPRVRRADIGSDGLNLRQLHRLPLEADAGLGRVRHHRELAERKAIAPSCMTGVLRLTLLAPDIIEAILDGWQGANVTQAGVPEGPSADWAERAEHFAEVG